MEREKRVTGQTQVRTRKMDQRRRQGCGGSRLWIFLVLGAVLVVLGLVVGGIYLNIHSLTSSLQHTEIVPTYVPVGAVLLVGVLVLLLFWKRVHLLVFMTSVISAGVAILCGGAAILTGTHIIQPMLHFIQCSMYEAQSECHCLSPYSRQQLSLEYSDKALAKYVYAGVPSCSAVQGELLQMLYGLCVVYILTFLVCIAVAVLALLAYHTERLYRRTLEDESYEEIFTVSNSSTPPNTDGESEHQNMIQSSGMPSVDEGETTPSDLIYSPSDVPVDYNEACRMRRSHSFSQPRRQNQSFDSTESSALYASSTLGRGERSRCQEGHGRLKEHRQRARRAVTLHNLDTQQLMLILSLQMRYLQENSSQRQAQMNTQKLDMQNCRSLTPTPQSTKQHSLTETEINAVKVARSHTPQPYQMWKLATPKPTDQNNFYENAYGLVPPLDYENIDSCVSTAQMAGLLRSAAILGTIANQHVRASPPQDGVSTPGRPNSKLHIAEVTCGANANGTASDVGGKSMTTRNVSNRANSYEDIDNMSSRGLNPASVAAINPICQNQQDTNQAGALGVLVQPHVMCSRRKRRPKPDASNTTSSSECSDQEHPTRPKSYINAVEGIAPTYCHDECQNAVSRLGRDLQHTSYTAPQNVGVMSQRLLPGASTSGVPYFSGFGPGRIMHDTSHDAESSQLDIYARPNKKGKDVMPRRGLTQQLASSSYVSTADHSSRKSAFHKVSRASSLASSDAPCDTDLDDLDPVAVQRAKRATSKPLPPYSPPPSYECLAHSRNSSLHSIASSSSHTTDDLDSDLYRQINKAKGPARSAPTPSQGTCHGLAPENPRQHPKSQGNCHSPAQSGSPSYLKGQNGFGSHQFQDFQFNCASDQLQVHSFPFSKTHNQQASYNYHPGQAPVIKGTPSVQSYENLDDVFEDPSLEQQALVSHNTRVTKVASANQLRLGNQRMDAMHKKADCHKAQYEGVIHLSSGNEDSDSEVMETVI